MNTKNSVEKICMHKPVLRAIKAGYYYFYRLLALRGKLKDWQARIFSSEK